MANIHGVFKAALNGIHERGTGGFVFVKGDTCGYMFPHELKGNEQLVETLEELMADEKAERVFYVVEERDNNLHLVAYPRDSVLKEILTETS